jgi:signal transduction histidine kinase
MAAAASLMAATTVVVLLRSELVHGPLATEQSASLVTVTACLLAVAAIATSLVLARVDLAWHSDGIACCALVVCLAAAIVVGWQDAPDPLRSAGAVVAPLAIPALLALVEQRARGSRRWSLLSAGVVGTLAGALYVVRDPFQDPDCWADCSLRDVAPLPSTGALRMLDATLIAVSWAVALLACGLLLGLAARSLRGGGGWRDLDLGIAGAAATAAVLGSVALLPTDRDAAADAAVAAITAQALLATLIILQPTRAVRRRNNLRSLALDLMEVPPLGTLQATLARVFGDRDLRVAYWLPESGRYVDAGGKPVDVDGEWTVTLQRDALPLAVVRLSHPDRDTREVEELIGSAVRLAIDSERLGAELRAQLSELRTSRQRIVMAADDTRRWVERSLHDVVQAELLAVLYELARVKAEADRNGGAALGSVTARLAEQLRELIGNLRDFAHGVYPAVLDAAGLPAALDALADEAPVALKMDCRLERRPSPEVERAAYLLIHDAVMRAEVNLDIDIAWVGPAVVVRVAGNADSVREDLVDRVGALGGSVGVDGGELRAVLPCA